MSDTTEAASTPADEPAPEAETVAAADQQIDIPIDDCSRNEGGPPTVADFDGDGEPEIGAAGADFYAAPRVSPDGRSIVWVQWMHPNMPWDVTELWVASLDESIGSIAITGERRLVGNGAEALEEPHWWADGTLVVATDRDEWWNLYRVDTETGRLAPEATGEFEVVESGHHLPEQ